jgi:toxin FitB
MRVNIVDSSGWIEYFTAGKNGPLFRKVILQNDNLIVPAISIYEVHKRLSQLTPADTVNECIAVMQKARVINLTPERAVAASHIATQHQLAMADAMMYAIALEFDALFWTQDVDYKGLANIEFHAKNTNLKCKK